MCYPHPKDETRMKLRLLIPATLCLLMSAATFVGAVESGRISGLVTDPDGASVAGVKLTLTHSNGNSREK